MNKLKIGDLVYIVGPKGKNENIYSWPEFMNEYLGKVKKIISRDCYYKKCFNLDIDDEVYFAPCWLIKIG